MYGPVEFCPYCGKRFWPGRDNVQDHILTCQDEQAEEERLPNVWERLIELIRLHCGVA
jgi:hypothetical protein